MKARAFGLVATFVIGFFVLIPSWSILQPDGSTVRQAVLMDVSPPIYELMAAELGSPQQIESRFDQSADHSSEWILLRYPSAIEQTHQGNRDPATLVESFDGLGYGFDGPQGIVSFRNPSDNSLAVGRDHIVQIVNSRTAIFTKEGRRYDSTGRVLYGPAETRNFFKGFGGPCEELNNGDAVVRYDQLANRWL
ncbi:MAG: hypothetical protein O7C39_08580, partial [Bacteroidetes bacterium]|nr:hypothetical protein [Bacteroidota bacterium]